MLLPAVCLFVPGLAIAAMSTWPVEQVPLLRPGEEVSPARGHLIAVGGGPGGSGAACFACHGLQGQGDAGGAFPRLAGLDAQYLARQMQDYASGARPNAAMSPISRALSQADRRSVALYYAGLPAGAPGVQPARPMRAWPSRARRSTHRARPSAASRPAPTATVPAGRA
ncbi:c-type cytochrome [Siccirubricoccus sp. G192]|uniref:c-type cytochrome n=1 Tax=Siccirubricoccus sp. G192 TaxID=2849651 RepID=UPI0035C8211C